MDRTGPGGQRRLIAQLGARCPFPPPGTAVDCAVSGGADSLCLLVLAAAAGLSVTVLHVDHGLRAGSAGEADAVAAAAAHHGARFVALSTPVAPGPNLEARARRARYAALPAGVLTGHTADDRAETMVLNMLRGTGVHGLAALRPSARRPLLALRRSETEALCAAVGLHPLMDPSNTDPAFGRNRVRHELLPLAADVAARQVVPLLTRLGDHLAEVADLLDTLAASLDPTDARALAAAPAPVAAAALRRWLRGVGGAELHPPDAATVARVLRVARGEARGTEVGGGFSVNRSRGRLRLEHTT